MSTRFLSPKASYAYTLTAMVFLMFLALTFILPTESADARQSNVVQLYELKRCPGKISVNRDRFRIARYKRISCSRARKIVRRLNRTRGAFPRGYGWMTPHGAGPYPKVFSGRLVATYLSPDGARHAKTRRTGGVAVVLYR